MSLSLPSVCMCVCARGCARNAEWKIDGFLPAVVVFFFFFFAGLFLGNVSCRRSRLREGVCLCVSLDGCFQGLCFDTEREKEIVVVYFIFCTFVSSDIGSILFEHEHCERRFRFRARFRGRSFGLSFVFIFLFPFFFCLIGLSIFLFFL